MSTITPTLEIFDKFISIASGLAELPQLVLPQYRDAAQDLYEIAQKLLSANENLSRWLYKFLYFDFRQQDARTKFLDLVGDYRTSIRWRCGGTCVRALFTPDRTTRSGSVSPAG